MLEIIIFTVVVFIAFIAVSFYAHYRSQKRANEFEQELDVGSGRSDPTLSQRFDAVFERVVQGDKPFSRLQKPIVVDMEEVVTLSQRAVTEYRDIDEDAFETPNDDINTSDEITILTDDVLFEQDMEQQNIELYPEPSASKLNEDSDTNSPEAKDEVKQDDWELVLSLTILAPEGETFFGRAIKSALDSQDLHFGDFQLYHKYYVDRRKILFSVANILEPGTLLPNAFVSMTTPGLLLFSRLPHVVNGMTLFDDMLSTAQEMAVRLNGILCDGQRLLLNDSSIELTRRRIMAYQMNAEEETTQVKNDQLN